MVDRIACLASVMLNSYRFLSLQQAGAGVISLVYVSILDREKKTFTYNNKTTNCRGTRNKKIHNLQHHT